MLTTHRSLFAPLLATLLCHGGCAKPQPVCPASSVAVPAAAQQQSKEASSAELVATDDRWRAALLAHDGATIDEVVAPEYTLTTAVGVVPRPAWRASSLLWQTKELEWRGEPHLDVYGESAVRRGTLHWHVIKDKADPRTGSAELDLDFLVTDVWERRAGRWQIVARHSTIPLAPNP